MKKLGYCIAFILCIVAFISLAKYVISDYNAAYEYSRQGEYVVEHGDTLWNIAEQCSSKRHDIRKVVDIIRYECNNNIAAEIYPGQSIYVPLFDCIDY